MLFTNIVELTGNPEFWPTNNKLPERVFGDGT
jgi:hypothetical protein